MLTCVTLQARTPDQFLPQPARVNLRCVVWPQPAYQPHQRASILRNQSRDKPSGHELLLDALYRVAGLQRSPVLHSFKLSPLEKRRTAPLCPRREANPGPLAPEARALPNQPPRQGIFKV